MICFMAKQLKARDTKLLGQDRTHFGKDFTNKYNLQMFSHIFIVVFQNPHSWDFPGGPVVKTTHSQCRGPRLDPWSGN